MPSIPAAGTNATVFAIAERAAEIVAGRIKVTDAQDGLRNDRTTA
jgi:choline dehydrogenase-like flavoprotein